MEIRIIEGDIAEQSADALVNAAGTSLRMGSGVAGALRRAGGEALNEAAIERGPIELGEAVATDAYGLDADIVVHAAAMPHHGDGLATVSSVASAARNALAVADEHGCETVVMPVLGTGAAGLSFEAGARTVYEAVNGYEPTSLTNVSIIAYGTEAYKKLGAVADEFERR